MNKLIRGMRIFLKRWTWVLLAVMSLSNIGYYGVSFYIEQNLQFSQEDTFILLLIAFSVIGLCVTNFLLFRENEKLRKLIQEVFERLNESEDNTVKLNRETQDLIIRMFKKNERNQNEKKD